MSDLLSRINDSKQCTAATFKTETQDNYENPRKTNVYRFLMDSYTGRGGFAGIADSNAEYCFLTPDPSERMYQTRAARSVYTNNFRPIINSKVDPIFSKKNPYTTVYIGEDAQDSHYYIDWCSNVNGLGQTKEQFNNNVMRAAVRDEVCYVVMDTGPDGLPIVYMQTAGTVDRDSIVTDEWGRLIQIGFIGAKDSTTKVRHLWSSESLIIQESSNGEMAIINSGTDNWITVEERPVTIGVMPVKPVFANPRINTDDYLPYPESASIAFMCHNIYDACSNYDWILHKQAHDTMIFKNADIEAVGTGVDWGIKISDPTGATTDVFPYSPSSEHPKNHLEAILNKQQELKKLANESGVDAAESAKQAESGIAKAFTFQARNETIQKMLNVVYSLDKWEQQTFKLYYGGGEWEAITTYATNFQPQPDITLEQLQDISDNFTLNNVDSGRRETLKLMASKIFDGMPDVLSEIILDIDKAIVQNDAEVIE